MSEASQSHKERNIDTSRKKDTFTCSKGHNAMISGKDYIYLYRSNKRKMFKTKRFEHL